MKNEYIIPTTQNNANIHHDLNALAEQALAEGKSEMQTEKLCEMLVRSYDPCISCSVHYYSGNNKSQFRPSQKAWLKP